MKIITGILIGVSLLTGSCQSKTDDHHHHDATTESVGPVAELEQQVLATHDSLMNQMSDLMRFKKAIAAHVEKETNNAAKQRGLAIRKQLEEADRMMMNWMQDYNGDTLKKLDQTGALAYLKSQQAKVNIVRDRMRKGIADAKHYVD